jgi:hepatocyte growth factor-regulated tyrosine kinase substrate
MAGPPARSGHVPSQRSPSQWNRYTEPPIVGRSAQPSQGPIQDDDDPELRAAIEASLREANAPKPSAPAVFETPRTEAEPVSYDRYAHPRSSPPALIPPPSTRAMTSYDLDPTESDAILTFSQTIEQVQSEAGRDMSRYPAVNEMYDKANSLRPKLALSLSDAGRKEGAYHMK